MNKKRPTKSTRGRVSGRQKASVRKSTRAARPLQDREIQDNSRGIKKYEILLGKEGSCRRGRSRSRAVPPMMMYIPGKHLLPQRQLSPCQIAPVLPMPRCQEAQPVRNQGNYWHPFQFRVQSMSEVLLPNNSEESKNINEIQNAKWPSDLEELVEEWDHLPGGHLWEVVKWMLAPEKPIKTPLPFMVANLQNMLAEWEETDDSKVQQILQWLGYSFESSSPLVQPKVVVEVEPAAVQACSQWSSLAERTESCEP